MRLPKVTRPTHLRLGVLPLALSTLVATNLLPATEPIVNLPSYLVEADKASTEPATTVLTRDDWQQRALTTLGDAIGQMPSLVLQESFGGFEPPRLSLRGSGVQSAPSSRGLALTLDGLPLGLADGSFNSAYLIPAIAEKIELSCGLDGWQTAPTTMGGALNLVTLRDPTPTLHSETGSFGAFRANASAATKPSTNLRLVYATSYERQDGYRPQSAQERSAFFASARKTTPQNGTISASLFFVRPTYDVPGPQTLSAAQNAPRSVSADAVRDQPRREAQLCRTALNANGSVSTFHYDTGVAWQHTTDWFRQLQSNGIGQSNSNDLSLRGGLSRQLEIAGSHHRLHLATTAARGWRDAKRFANNASQTGALFAHDGLQATTATITAEDTMQLGSKLLATLGGSTTHARRDIVDRMPMEISPVRTTLNLSQSTNLAAAGLQWSITPGHVIFAGFTQTTEPPTFDDILIVTGSYPNLSRRSLRLQNQRANTFELGTRGNLGPVKWNLTIFRSAWSNELLRLADANGLPRGVVNAGPTLHTGIESALRWKIYDHHHRLTLTTKGVWSRLSFENDPVFRDNRLAGVPPCTGSAELLYEHPRGIFVGSSLDWTAGRTPVDHAGQLTYGGHLLAHLRAGWHSSKTWSLYTEIQNIFGQRFIASTAGVLDVARNPAATAVFLPGNGRAFTIGFEWKH